jgi:hypothetical protein
MFGNNQKRSEVFPRFPNGRILLAARGIARSFFVRSNSNLRPALFLYQPKSRMLTVQDSTITPRKVKAGPRHPAFIRLVTISAPTA